MTRYHFFDFVQGLTRCYNNCKIAFATDHKEASIKGEWSAKSGRIGGSAANADVRKIYCIQEYKIPYRRARAWPSGCTLSR